MINDNAIMLSNPLADLTPTADKFTLSRQPTPNYTSLSHHCYTLPVVLQAKFMSGGWETPSVWPDDVFDKTNYLCDKVGR